jgi:LysM repeat protein
MIAFVGVDGTGSYDPGQYHQDYGRSNIRTFVNYTNNKGKAHYLAGPGLDGGSTWWIATAAASWARSFVNQGCDKLVLAGHSRGGAAVIEAAYQLLEEDGIKVDLMLLFDAVNMTGSVGLQRTHKLPSNVLCCRHAYRDPGTKSRATWGNCGMTKGSGSQDAVYQKYWTTHGGLGGVPQIPGPGESWGDRIVEDGTIGATNVTYQQCQDGYAQATSWLFGELNKFLSAAANSQQETTSPGAGTGAGGSTGGSNGGTGGGKGSKQYIVASGDSLSLISGKFYQDVLLWPVLYDTNKSTVGPDPNLIKPGMKLTVPDISGMSSSQISQTRERGRNWH